MGEGAGQVVGVAVTASPKDHVGARLRLARIQRGLELEEAANATRITPRYLEALERNAPPAAFPAPVYARAFLREYAQWLGIDPEPLLDSYFGAHPEPAQPLTLLSPLQRPTARWVRPALIAASITVLFTLAVVSARPGTLRSPLPGLPSPPATAFESARVTEAEREPVSRGVVLSFRVVRAPCWVKVTSDTRIVVQTTARPGFAKTFTAARRLDLWIGNAGAVRLTLNGRRLPIPGRRGAIYRVSFIADDNRVRLKPYSATA